MGPDPGRRRLGTDPHRTPTPVPGPAGPTRMTSFLFARPAREGGNGAPPGLGGRDVDVLTSRVSPSGEAGWAGFPAAARPLIPAERGRTSPRDGAGGPALSADTAGRQARPGHGRVTLARLPHSPAPHPQVGVAAHLRARSSLGCRWQAWAYPLRWAPSPLLAGWAPGRGGPGASTGPASLGEPGCGRLPGPAVTQACQAGDCSPDSAGTAGVCPQVRGAGAACSPGARGFTGVFSPDSQRASSGRGRDWPHCTGGYTEARRAGGSCPRPQSWTAAEPGRGR